MSAPLVCLVTPGHLASTPRLVKSADALVGAGYRVHVVAAAPFPPADPLDASILASAAWGYTRVPTRKGPAVLARKLLRRFARVLVGRFDVSSPSWAALAQSAEADHLASAAARIPAQLYLGHSIASLYPVAAAARARGSLYGFDIEDFHDAETEDAMADAAESRARRLLQAAFLPGSRPLTCAAPLIGKKYAEAYGVRPATVLNVFPTTHAPAKARPARTFTEELPAVLYWFSQTVGPGRGLENVLGVMGRMRTPCVLHVRGFAAPSYIEHLQETARVAGLRRPVIVLPPAEPGEMARLASEADLGLSVELPVPLNHDLCLPNKIFVYLMAGIPQILSSTTAQRSFGGELGEAALVCEMDQTDASASRIDALLGDPEAVRRARTAAWEAAHGRYCWEIEKRVLLEAVATVLPPTL